MPFQMMWSPASAMRAGALEELGPRAKALGATKALIVTDRGLVDCGIAGRTVDQLVKAGAAAEIFPEQPNSESRSTQTDCRKIEKTDIKSLYEAMV